MKRTILCLTAGLAFASVSAQDYQPLTVSSGFTEKVIAYSNLPASVSTTADVDGEDKALMNTTFQPVWGMPGPAYALPADGLINSAATTGLSFQLAPASAVNVLRLPGQNDSGTLEFDEAIQAGNLYLLATSGKAASEIFVTVHFSDGTLQEFAEVLLPNWLSGTGQPVARQGFGYVKRDENLVVHPANDPKLFQIALDIAAANESKMIESVEVTKTSSNAGVVNVFAVTAEAPFTCPTHVPVAEDQSVCAGSMLSGLAVSGDEGAVFTWYDAETGGNVLDPGLPIAETTYYVSQTAGGCESARTAVTVTVLSAPHTPVGEEMQNFTEGQTVGDLEVAFDDGTTHIWYMMNDAGESVTVTPGTLLEDGMTYYAAQMQEGCRSEALAVTVTEILGTGSHTMVQTALYPNPAGEHVTVTANAPIKDVRIMNLLGQCLLTQAGNGENTVVDLAALASGNYILILTTTDGGTESVRLVKK